MEPWTMQGQSFRFHLRCRMEVGEVPMIPTPGLYLYFHFGSVTHFFAPYFWSALLDPDGWWLGVQHMLSGVILRGRGEGDGSFNIPVLAGAFCRYFDAALLRFPCVYGRAMVVNAHIHVIHRLPTPPLADDDAVGRRLHGGRRRLGPPPGFEAVIVDDLDLMILPSVEDLPLDGEGSGDTPASSASVFPESVKTVTLGEAEAEKVDSDESCSICLDGFEQDQQLGVMPCHHRFHSGCLKQWLARSRRCPLCRFDLSLWVPAEE